MTVIEYPILLSIERVTFALDTGELRAVAQHAADGLPSAPETAEIIREVRAA